MAFGTLLWKIVILTSATLLLRDIAGIGSAPLSEILRAKNAAMFSLAPEVVRRGELQSLRNSDDPDV